MQRVHPQRQRQILWTALLSVVASLAAYGCQQSSVSSAPATTMASAKPSKGGAELWSENCMRCHNLRPPGQYSNNEWTVIIHEMRVRANLTGEESDKILKFIKSSNATN